MDIKATATLSDADVDKIADAVVAKLQASATVTKTEKPAADKTKDKPATKPKADEAKALTLQDVLAALKAHAEKHNKDSAIEVLKRFAPKAADVPEDKRADLIAALEADPAPAAEEDEF